MLKIVWYISHRSVHAKLTIEFIILLSVYLGLFIFGMFFIPQIFRFTGSKSLTLMTLFVIYPTMISFIWGYMTLGFIAKYQMYVADEMNPKKRIKALKSIALIKATRKYIYFYFYVVCLLILLKDYLTN